MTEQEFARGWKFLILQPWGSRYRGVDGKGQPTAESKAQLEYYFDQLKWSHPDAWMHVVREIYGRGDHWPSVADLRSSLLHIQPRYVQAIDKPRPPGVSMKEALEGRPDLIAKLKRFGIEVGI